jgi:hypothetical protein
MARKKDLTAETVVSDAAPYKDDATCCSTAQLEKELGGRKAFTLICISSSLVTPSPSSDRRSFDVKDGSAVPAAYEYEHVSTCVE